MDCFKPPGRPPSPEKLIPFPRPKQFKLFTNEMEEIETKGKNETAGENDGKNDTHVNDDKNNDYNEAHKTIMQNISKA